MHSKQIYLSNIGEITITRNRLAVRFKITVKPDGKIGVTIPWMASFASGEKFISGHLNWIAKTKEKQAEKHFSRKLIQPGRIFSTRNYHYRICPADLTIPRIKYAEKEKEVLFEYPADKIIESYEVQNSLKQMIENVLRFDARLYLPARIAELAANLGYSYNKMTIKNNKTNWGSCSIHRNINLNLHLMRLNDRLIDYIIIHELVHTVIPDHGKEFKATMQKHFPDTAEIDKELKKIKTGIY